MSTEDIDGESTVTTDKLNASGLDHFLNLDLTELFTGIASVVTNVTDTIEKGINYYYYYYKIFFHSAKL